MDVKQKKFTNRRMIMHDALENIKIKCFNPLTIEVSLISKVYLKESFFPKVSKLKGAQFVQRRDCTFTHSNFLTVITFTFIFYSFISR